MNVEPQIELRCGLCSQRVGDGGGQVLSSQYKTTMSQISVREILNTIIKPLSHSSITENPSLCTRCFKLLDTIDTLQVQLKLKKSEVVNLYGNTNSNKNNQNPKPAETESAEKKAIQVTVNVIEVAEPPKKKDKGLLTSADLKCQVCEKTFEKRRYLMDHLRRVHNSAVHQCKACSSRFKLKEDLTTHQSECPAFLKSRKQQQQQATAPTSEAGGCLEVGEGEKVLTKRKKNNKCGQCERYFLTQALLKSHTRIVHDGGHLDETELDLLDETKIEKPVLCSVCEITVNNQYALSIHQGSVHGFERPWGCQICPKSFARHLELVNHRRVHSGDKPFQCDICGSRFNQKQNLQTHVRHIHLGERRYQCSLCQMKFRRRRLLDCHINSKHKLERPYQCRQCSATFVYPEHVRKHEMTHQLTQTRLKCPHCEKTFKRKTSLENHAASHRPTNTFQCLSCPQYFLSRQDLLDHLKLTNHPKGVQSSSQQDVLIQDETKEKVGVNMSIIETVNVYDDVVLLLAGEAVVPVPDVETHSVYVDQVVEQPDEIQTAISSIVEIEQTQ